MKDNNTPHYPKGIYISLPMTGVDSAEIHRRIELAKSQIIARGDIPIAPTDLSAPGTPYYTAMGYDISAIISDKVDMVLFLEGWDKSRGCRLEHAAARIYGKEVDYQRPDEGCFP